MSSTSMAQNTAQALQLSAQAAALAQAGDFERAGTCINQALQLDPQCAEAWQAQALMLLGMQQPRDAALALNRALARAAAVEALVARAVADGDTAAAVTWGGVAHHVFQVQAQLVGVTISEGHTDVAISVAVCVAITVSIAVGFYARQQGL